MSAAMRHLKKRWNDRRPESFSSGEGDSSCEQSSSNRSCEVKRPSSHDERFPVGTRVKKYFHGHGWCLGQVVGFVKGRYQVQYEHLATKKDCFYEAHEMPRLIKTALVVPGTRLEIYWPHEQRYYKALIKSEQCRKRENYWICYEARKSCADREWIDLHRHKFRVLETPQEAPAFPPRQHMPSNSKEDVVVVVQPDASDENDESLDSWGKATSIGDVPTVDDKFSGNLIAGLPNAITSSVPDDCISPQSSVQLEGDEMERIDLLASPGLQTEVSHEKEMDVVNVEKVSPSSSNSRCSTGIVAKMSEFDVISPILEYPNEKEAVNSTSLPSVSNSSSPRRKCIVEELEEITCDPLDTTLDFTVFDVDVVTSEPLKHETVCYAKDQKDEGIIIDPDSDLATRSAVCSLIEVGSRVAVYWEEDDEFFPGTITDRTFRGKPFFLEYDDGEEEWIDLRKHRFRLLPPVVNDDTAASRRRRPSNPSNESMVIHTRKRQQQPITPSNCNNPSAVTSSDSRQTRSSSKNDAPLALRNTSSHSVRSVTDKPTLVKPKRSTPVKNPVVDLSDSSVSAESEWSLDSPRTKRPVDRRDRVDADIAQITVGSRVAIWWDGDKRYYNGVVQRQRNHKKPFYFVYDDGEAEEWIDFRQQKFKLLSDEPSGKKQHKKGKVITENDKKLRAKETLGVNRRKSDSAFDEEMDSHKKGGRTLWGEKDDAIDRDDNLPMSEQKRVSGRKRKFSDGADSIKSSVDVCSLITVGTRVAVYWEGESKYYEGVVTRERNSSKRRHYLEYDDGEAAHWIDFREHWVRILPDRKTRRSKRCSNTGSPPNEKNENDDDIVPQNVVATRSKKQKTSEEVSLVAQAAPITRKRLNATPESPAESSHRSTRRHSISERRSSPSRSILTRVLAGDIAKLRREISKGGKGKSSSEKADKDNGTPGKSGKSKAGHEKTDGENMYRGKSERNKDGPETFDYDKFLSENPENAFEMSKICVGSRVEIWWNGDEKYYKGTVSRITPKKFFVLYDDGEVEWVSKIRQKYRLLEQKRNIIHKKPKKVHSRKVESESENSEDEQSSVSEEDHMAYDDFVFGKVDQLRVGSRISVWWTGDKKYYNGTLKKINDRTGVRRPYFVRYDDHDEEWTDLRRRYFRVLN